MVACLRAARGDIARAFRALRPMVAADPEADALAALAALGRIEKIAEARCIACVDRVRTIQPYLRLAARRLAEAVTVEQFEAWAERDLTQRARRHQGAIGFWRAVAETAPAMGMIGTVIGLIRMFAALDDVSRIGPAMALAMLTTLYGIILSTVVAGPVAARLERLSAAKLAWQREALKRLSKLAEAELAPSPRLLRTG